MFCSQPQYTKAKIVIFVVTFPFFSKETYIVKQLEQLPQKISLIVIYFPLNEELWLQIDFTIVNG